MVFHKVEGGLFESSVEQIMQDNYGGYWLASSNSGALHIARTRFTDISAMAMLPEVTYNAENIRASCIWGRITACISLTASTT